MDQELVQYLNERFDGIDRRFEGVDGQIKGLRQEMREGQEEVKRHFGVLAEDLRYQVRLVAEGFAVFVDGRYTQDQANIDRRFDETNALTRNLYAQINQRVENLERTD